MGVSLGLENPATVAVMDARTSKVLAYRSTRQLLGNSYHLLNRQRQMQQQNTHERHKAQKSGRSNSLCESELG
jgi:queuine/archaeosine tRNA-ribosyltransferase